MSRLKQMTPRLAVSPRRQAFAPDQAKGPATVQQSTPWKAWYKTKAWRELKLKVHIRDGYTCQRTGALCVGKYPAPNSPVANHKRPHRGNPVLFWDENNVETVTKAVHDSTIQAEEQVSRQQQGVWD